MRIALIALAGALALAGCNTTTTGSPPGPPPAPPPSSAPPGVTPSGFVLPGGSGCAGEVARFQAVIDNDVATGHTTRPVYDRMNQALAGARATCASGQDGRAIAEVNAIKARHGYR
jgi:hypothetical protein